MFWKQSKNKKGVRSQDSFDSSLRFVVANWKCHKNLAEAKLWFEAFATAYTPADNLNVVIAPTFLCLPGLAEYVKTLSLERVYLAAQDVSPFPRGGYTGEISADMLKGLVDYVIVGHSERRRYFHETSQQVCNKVSEVIEAGLIPLICVDSSYAMSQLTVLNELETKKVLIAYGPEDALQFNIPQSVDKVGEVVGFIEEVHPGYPVLYGGALSAGTAAEYGAIDKVSGLFVGGASLDGARFAELCKVYGQRDEQ